MKLRKLLQVFGIAAAIGISFAAGAWAQSKRVIWHWPDSMDAQNAAPKNHKVLFENDHVLLLEVTIEPGETENMHGHKWPSIFAYDAVQPKLNNHTLVDDGRQLVGREFEDKDWYEPQCRPLGPEAPHQVTIWIPSRSTSTDWNSKKWTENQSRRCPTTLDEARLSPEDGEDW
jgi:hypothetical protein